MVIEQKRYKETVEEIVNRRREELQETRIMLDKVDNSRSLITKSLKKYADDSMTADTLLNDLIEVLNRYRICDSTRLREVIECLYFLLTV